MKKEKERMLELSEIINKAARAYYMEDREIMSNYEYDALFDELLELEAKTGVILPGSPTQKVGYEVVSELKKVTHEFIALSLDKTKDLNELAGWLGEHDGCLSWKMDGLTIVATYENGVLKQAVTRGNGYIGEDVTHNAVHFAGLPKKIPCREKIVIRGEATIAYEKFEEINKNLPIDKEPYKNPRNLASASVRLFNAKEAAEREIVFTAFRLVLPPEDSEMKTVAEQFEWLKTQGINVVEYCRVTKESLSEAVKMFETKIIKNKFPSDGLVLLYNNIAYGDSLGRTGHHFRNGLAFKWKDETATATLKEIEWSASRSGLLNPVAVFTPVELEGTTVSRASLHNVSVTKKLNVSPGAVIKVYKANMIIPQVLKTVTEGGGLTIPDKCPICGMKTAIVTTHSDKEDVDVLYCTNPDCAAKHIGVFTHFVSREGMDIKGLSKAALEKFVENGFIKEFADIYHLDNYKEDIIKLDGFGKKSFEKLIESVEKSRNCSFSQFLAALGIPGVGKDLAKVISRSLGSRSVEEFSKAPDSPGGFTFIEGVGETIDENIYKWRTDPKNIKVLQNLLKELNIAPDVIEENKETPINGKTFVITGSLESFANRDELKKLIENNGGKTSGSVSAKTSYLINNDIASSTGKSKKAKELNIPIITEKQFLEMLKI